MSIAAFDNPLTRTAASFVVAYGVVFFTDRFSMPGATREKYRPEDNPGLRIVDALARIPMVLLIFAIFFAISWRPLYALAGTISFFVIFTGISFAKLQFIREPLIFSDIALVVDVFRHKEIFYATRLNVLFWVFALGYIFGASALFMIFEPPILPAQHHFWIVLMIAAVCAPLLALLNKDYRRTLSRIAESLFGSDDIRVLVVRLGTFTSVAYHFLLWVGRRPTPPGPRNPNHLSSQSEATQQPLIVVWQSESFMDMRHFGLDLDLPNLDRLRERAAEWGRLLSVFEGGYTLRTEFAVLTGLKPDDIGADAAYPYLRVATYADMSWPMRFRRAKLSTHFLHPYDRKFFLRHRAIPRLGFDTMTMLDAFDHDAIRDGRYVSDMTLSKRVVDLCRQEPDGKGQFIFAASMENHGPWNQGRHGAHKEPLDIYLGILQKSDAALGYLVEELDRMERPVWLVFYGDHAPMLKSFADPFPDPRTDYLMVHLGRSADMAVEPVTGGEKAPWDLIGDLVDHLELKEKDRALLEAEVLDSEADREA